MVQHVLPKLLPAPALDLAGDLRRFSQVSSVARRQAVAAASHVIHRHAQALAAAALGPAPALPRQPRLTRASATAAEDFLLQVRPLSALEVVGELLQRDQAATALQHLDAGLRQRPEDADLHDLRGRVLQHMGYAQEADAARRRAQRLDARARYFPEEALWRGGEAADVDLEAELLTLAQLTPDDVSVLADLARFYFAGGRDDDAWRLARRALAHDTRLPDLQLILAELHLQQQWYDGAIAHLNQGVAAALADDSSLRLFDRAWYELCQSPLTAAQSQTLLAGLEAMRAARVHDAAYYWLLARAYRLSGELEQAITACWTGRSIHDEPSSVPFMLNCLQRMSLPRQTLFVARAAGHFAASLGARWAHSIVRTRVDAKAHVNGLTPAGPQLAPEVGREAGRGTAAASEE